MKRTHFPSTLTSVRLFPRLAARPSAKTKSSCRRSTTAQRSNVKPDKGGADSRTVVRARLLKMIVDNERVRRQEPHAS